MGIATNIAPIILGLIMFGLGLGLQTKDFLRVINHPKNFIVGFICQLILLPIVAWILILIFRNFIDLSLELALGVMIIASVPGGVTTNVMTKFAKGDVGLSISLTAVISLISIISVPFIIFNSAKMLGIQNISEEITMSKIAIQMAAIVTIPVILGMIVRKFAEEFVTSKVTTVERTTSILFIIFFIGVWLEEKDNLLRYIQEAGLVTLILNVVMMIIAYYIAKFFTTGMKQRKTISIECGLQNGTLAIAVAKMIFDEEMLNLVIVPTATYALIMYITGFALIFILRRSN